MNPKLSSPSTSRTRPWLQRASDTGAAAGSFVPSRVVTPLRLVDAWDVDLQCSRLSAHREGPSPLLRLKPRANGERNSASLAGGEIMDGSRVSTPAHDGTGTSTATSATAHLSVGRQLWHFVRHYL